MEQSKLIGKAKRRGTIFPSISVCVFCKMRSDETKFGKFFTSNEHAFSVHQYCMFFSAGLPQNGADDEGFEGFLEKDIVKEISRSSRLNCTFCHKKGASAGCCFQSCRRTFHFPCGESQKCLFQYFEEFRVFCNAHRPQQSVSSTSSHQNRHTTCAICLEDILCDVSPDTLTTPCCKDTWFHRSCVQQQAANSGYLFRCAVCNNAEKFKKEMKEMGIYVPDRDAAWEKDDNFAELLEKYSRCDSLACGCPHGRNFSDDNGSWELVLCTSCGQYGIHVGCGKWLRNPRALYCPTCRPAHIQNACDSLSKSSGGSSRRKQARIPERSKDPLNSDSPSASCGNSGGKSIAQAQRKRARKTCDDDIDLSAMLNGLKRHASDDFLDSDTRRSLEMALAAGTAATQDSRRDKPSQDSEVHPRCIRGTNVVLHNSENAGTSDDDCVITKYVPGYKICTKCHRRKPTKTVSMRLCVSESPRRHPTTTTTTLGPSPSMTSPGTNTAPRENRAADDCGISRPLFMESLGSKANTSTESGEKGFEIIERAARSIDKSSVLLIPSLEEEEEQGEGKLPARASDGSPLKTTGKKDSQSLLTVDDVVASLTSIKPASSLATSFFASSVEKIVQFLNPRPSELTRERSKGAVASHAESDNISIHSNETELVKSSLSPNDRTASSVVDQIFPNRDCKSNNIT